MSQASSKDLLPLLVMLESISKIDIYTRGFSNAAEFYRHHDQVHFNGSLLLLLNIGEHANKLSDELRARYAHLPLEQIRGLRNRIAHDYTGIDYEMVFDIVKKNIPAIKPQIVHILRTEIMLGNVDPGELNAARQSEFYKHIDFSALD